MQYVDEPDPGFRVLADKLSLYSIDGKASLPNYEAHPKMVRNLNVHVYGNS